MQPAIDPADFVDSRNIFWPRAAVALPNSLSGISFGSTAAEPIKPLLPVIRMVFCFT
jgi:hypothetical protein